MDYNRGNREQHGPAIAYKDQKPSAQKLSTKPSTQTGNLKRQGVGVTRTSTSGQTVTYRGSDHRRSYPVNIVNKAKARIGGN